MQANKGLFSPFRSLVRELDFIILVIFLIIGFSGFIYLIYLQEYGLAASAAILIGALYVTLKFIKKYYPKK